MTRTFVKYLYPFAVGVVLSATAQAADDAELLVFISAFAKGDEGAIQAYRLNQASGKLKSVDRTGGMEHPFFMALSPDRKYLYAIHAPGQFGGKNDEQVSAYELKGQSGQMKLLNRQSSRGTASCYLELDATGKSVFVANYSSGSVASLPVQADGSLGQSASMFQYKGSTDGAKTTISHGHSIIPSPNNKFVYAADLGLDRILSYRLDPKTAVLVPTEQGFVNTPTGAGPRHLAFHPNGKQLFVINELNNTVMSFGYNAETGFLIEQQTLSTVPKDFTGKSFCADLKCTPNGKYLYGTNRGHDSIACYQIDGAGKMTLLKIEPSLGKGPQNLAITPDGSLLLCANMPGNNVAVFRIDAGTGLLKAVGEPTAMPSPSCIRIY